MKQLLLNATSSINLKAASVGSLGFVTLAAIPVVDVLDMAIKAAVAIGTLIATFKQRKPTRKRKKPASV